MKTEDEGVDEGGGGVRMRVCVMERVKVMEGIGVSLFRSRSADTFILKISRNKSLLGSSSDASSSLRSLSAYLMCT